MSLKNLSNAEMVALRDKVGAEEDLLMSKSGTHMCGTSGTHLFDVKKLQKNRKQCIEVAEEMFARMLDGRMNFDDNGDLMEQV